MFIVVLLAFVLYMNMMTVLNNKYIPNNNDISPQPSDRALFTDEAIRIAHMTGRTWFYFEDAIYLVNADEFADYMPST